MQVAKRVEGTTKKDKAIDKWIKDIGDLHKSKPLASVTYTKYAPHEGDNSMTSL